MSNYYFYLYIQSKSQIFLPKEDSIFTFEQIHSVARHVNITIQKKLTNPCPCSCDDSKITISDKYS